MTFTKKLHTSPYSTMVNIVLTSDIDSARKSFDLGRSDKSNWDKLTKGLTYLFRGGKKRDKYEVFLFVNVPRHETLKDIVDTFSHEVVHVLDLIFNNAGIDTDYNNNEPYAYLHGFITGEVWDLFMKNQSKEFCVKEGYLKISNGE